MREILKKKFKPRIKARIRKNKQIFAKNIDGFFEWIKGAELIELKECNINEDPVRPELDNIFRRSYGRKIYGVNIWVKYMQLCVLHILMKYQKMLMN